MKNDLRYRLFIHNKSCTGLLLRRLLGLVLLVCFMATGQLAYAYADYKDMNAGVEPKKSLSAHTHILPGKKAADQPESKKNIAEAVWVQEDTKAERPKNLLHAITWGDKSKRELSLTFDDGNSKESILKVLEVMKKNNLKATFFITGKALTMHSGLWKQAIDDGHQVCNHTQNHVLLSKLPDKTVENEIKGWEKTAAKVLGEDYLKRMKEEFPYFRLPGGDGAKSTRILKIIANNNYIPIGWSAETYYSVLRHHKLKKEPVGPIADEVAKHVVKNSQNGAIILLHFNSFDTTRLEYMIEGILKKGYGIKPVSEIISYK